MSSIDASFRLPAHILKGTPREKLEFVQGIARKVVDLLTLVDSAFLEDDGSEDGSEDGSKDGSENVTKKDRKHNYTRVLCHYGSLVIEFHDAWAEA